MTRTISLRAAMWLTLIMLWFCQPVWAQTVLLNDSLRQLDVTPLLLTVRTDEQQQLSSVQGMHWSAQRQISPLDKGQALWAKLTLQNQASHSRNIQLQLLNPGINRLEWYLLDNKGRIRLSHFSGIERLDDEHRIEQGAFVLPVSMLGQENLTLYIKVIDDGPVILPLRIYSQQQWQHNADQQRLFNGLILGALLVLASYFMANYILLRSPVRFWYSAACLMAALLYINSQGDLASWPQLAPHSAAISAGLLALTVGFLAKVSHYILFPVGGVWRRLTYLLCMVWFVAAWLLDSYQLLWLSAGFAVVVLLLQLVLSALLRPLHSALPNRLLSLGWLLIAATTFWDMWLYLHSVVLDPFSHRLLLLLTLFGAFIIGLAVASSQQARQASQQRKLYDSNLRLEGYQRLFDGLPQGVFVATFDGMLMQVNPAMCKLFGYPDEHTLLEDIKQLRQLFTRNDERQSLFNELPHKGQVLSREIQGKKRDGSDCWLALSMQLKMEQGQPLLYGAMTDITEDRNNALNLAYQASHDTLTGLFNRRELERRLNQALADQTQLGRGVVLMVAGVDQLEQVSQQCGHEAANILLRQLARKIEEIIHAKALLARLNNDDFAILLHGELAEQAESIAEKLHHLADEFRFAWENQRFQIGFSIGISSHQQASDSAAQLLIMADAASAHAREAGGSQTCRYAADQPNQVQRLQADLNWLDLLHQAFQKHQFSLYYQPIYPLKQATQGHFYEVLLRLDGQDQQLIPPASFLPAAERHNLAGMIDRWVIEHYFSWLAAHPDHLQNLHLACINISSHSLTDAGFKQKVLEFFSQYQIPYHKICFEMNETAAMQKFEETSQFVNAMSHLGCQFALDDFGSDLSSFTHLKRLTVNKIKIDGSLIENLLVDAVDLAMVKAIQDVANTLGVDTVAESVESKDIMVELGKLGVANAQGFAIASPAPLLAFKPL